jgi:hypothetical protein
MNRKEGRIEREDRIKRKGEIERTVFLAQWAFAAEGLRQTSEPVGLGKADGGGGDGRVVISCSNFA